jgi:hypothetical protein
MRIAQVGGDRHNKNGDDLPVSDVYARISI